MGILQPLLARNFRLMWLGESVSLLGDQFHYVALSWLTLQLTNSGLALGTVLMVSAIPRLLFMLVGGAVSDRMSPRTLMLVSNALRALLVGVLAGLVALGQAQLWHLYVLAAVFGLIDAFFYPAINAIVPSLVEPHDLGASNALLQGTTQLTLLIGPAASGYLIAAAGTAIAFALNSASFVFAAVMLGLMRGVRPQVAFNTPPTSEPGRENTGAQRLLADIMAGLRYAWGHPIIRVMLLVVAAIDFSFIGPFNVGLASLADQRFAGGSKALGIMLSAWGGGALLGVLIAGSIKTPRHRGPMLLGVVSVLGVGLALLGSVPNVWVASLVIAIMGMGSGFVNVLAIAWLQAHTDSSMIGRVMSLVMFASAGLSPISYALAGAMVDLHAGLLFGIAGAIVLVATALAALSPLREMD
jgi:MFS family permease